MWQGLQVTPKYPSIPTFFEVLNIWFLAGYMAAQNKDYISQQ